jgi:predicted HTH transcriptional regulator
MVKTWENRAIALLDRSLSNIPVELNELDWKSALSENTEKLAKHLSAFSQLDGGGFLVFGINNDGGFGEDLTKDQVDNIIKKLGNIANNNLNIALTIDHVISNYSEHNLLFIFIPESINKPVYLKGNDLYETYKRSAGQTVKMPSSEVKGLIALSQNVTFEQQIALHNLTADEVIELLDFTVYYRLLPRPLPKDRKSIIEDFINEDLIKIGTNETYHITNLGAILFARKIDAFRSIKRKTSRLIIYKGTNKVEAIKEIIGTKGYAAGFEGLISYILDKLPSNEIIEHALRKESKMYPEVAIREFVANALIHQDFSMSGTSVMIEIFNDRIEITNPGIPLIDTNRFIGASPKSRNETIAALLRRLHICEERGSGVVRAIGAIEAFQLPAPKFIKEEDYTKVIMYSQKSLSKMDKEDRVRACYQHACLQHVSNQKTNNQSIRKRFSISDKNYPMASRIIADTMETGLIKLSDSGGNSRKHATYLPFWA